MTLRLPLVLVDGKVQQLQSGDTIPATGGATLADGDYGDIVVSSSGTVITIDTAASPQVTALNIGHATDTTLARSGAGDLTIEGNAIYRAGGTDVPLADGGTGASLADPGADRLMFWDDSAGAVTWLTLGTNLSITGTTINAAGGGGGGDLLAANNLSDVASAATSRTNLGATTVGANVFTLTNPSAITFLRVNADNTVSALDASTFRTAIGAGSGTGDLVAANNLSDVANAATARTNLGLAIGTNVQAYDADLTTYASISPSANVQTLLGSADYAAFRTSLGLVIGTNVQAYDADLTTWAGITPGTGVATALAVNVGSAGAVVVLDGAGGTPSSLTLTNATGLPAAALVASTSQAVGFGTIELGHASDTTLARSAAGQVTIEGNAIYHAGNKPPESIIIACSDETTAITTGTAKVTFRMPYAFTLTAVRASVTTAPTGATLTIDINENTGGGATTILSTKLTIDVSEKTSTTAATPAVISDASLADDAEITIDFDQVGSTVAGAGVKVYLIGNRT